MSKAAVRLLLTAVLFLTAVSCRDKSSDDRDPVKVNRSVTFTLEPGKWIYYSISDSSIVGKSDIGSAADDEEWKGRSDWDIALSESGIRTNGGSSGCGKGGLAIISDKDFEEESFQPLTLLEYTADTLDVCAVIPLRD